MPLYPWLIRSPALFLFFCLQHVLISISFPLRTSFHCPLSPSIVSFVFIVLFPLFPFLLVCPLLLFQPFPFCTDFSTIVFQQQLLQQTTIVIWKTYVPSFLVHIHQMEEVSWLFICHDPFWFKSTTQRLKLSDHCAVHATRPGMDDTPNYAVVLRSDWL